MRVGELPVVRNHYRLANLRSMDKEVNGVFNPRHSGKGHDYGREEDAGRAELAPEHAVDDTEESAAMVAREQGHCYRCGGSG